MSSGCCMVVRVTTDPAGGHVAQDPGDAVAADPAREAAALGAGMFSQAFWDERYSSRGAVWSGNPNPHLISQASELSGGRALDVGSGEGADAIWLAGRGWQVTALDVSPVALRRGASRAAEVGAEVARRIDWLHEDILTWIPDPSSYDLVSSQFMHLPTGTREEVFARLAEAVAPGGTLLIVGHHPSDLQTTIPRPAMPELFFTASEVAASLDSHAWEIVVDAAPERSTTDPEGHTVMIHDAVLRARRRD